jgi:hypothetical protein
VDDSPNLQVFESPSLRLNPYESEHFRGFSSGFSILPPWLKYFDAFEPNTKPPILTRLKITIFQCSARMTVIDFRTGHPGSTPVVPYPTTNEKGVPVGRPIIAMIINIGRPLCLSAKKPL